MLVKGHVGQGSRRYHRINISRHDKEEAETSSGLDVEIESELSTTTSQQIEGRIAVETRKSACFCNGPQESDADGKCRWDRPMSHTSHCHHKHTRVHTRTHTCSKNRVSTRNEEIARVRAACVSKYSSLADSFHTWKRPRKGHREKPKD